MLVLLAVLRRWAWLRDIARQPRTLATFALSALLLSSNWLVYVWAVNHGRVVESSLAGFLLIWLALVVYTGESLLRMRWRASL